MSKEDMQLLLTEYKAIMGIAEDDNSLDAILLLYMSAAIEKAKYYACDWHKWTYEDLPASIKLGIFRYLQLSQERGERSGIASESIGGMSQSFITGEQGNTDAYFNEAYDFFKQYCRGANGLNFVPAKRGVCGRGKGSSTWSRRL